MLIPRETPLPAHGGEETAELPSFITVSRACAVDLGEVLRYPFLDP